MLAGRAPKILPPLDLSCGTEFQQSVWQVLLKIPLGETRSYGELAKNLKHPRAFRAVGSACGANPIPVLVPCHRVLAQHRKLGGFTSGLDWKRRLLWREEVRDWWQAPKVLAAERA
jgi:O-6-methylguanine DNA methyltransferase